MKKIYTIILAALATLFSTSLAFADGDPNAISAIKTVKPIGDGSQFQLSLETFVKGEALNSSAKSSNMDIILVLDRSGSMGDKIDGTPKLTTLKTAAKQFVDIIAEDATKHSASHKISVVQFSSENGRSTYTSVVQGLTGTFSDVKTAIDGLKASGATRSDLGMELAQQELGSNRSRDDAIKCVVMFTDGTPTSNSSFSNTVANNAITYAKSMKDTGVIVYTIGLFDNSDLKDTKIQGYMNGVSSNYLNATAYNNLGQKNPNGKEYYFKTADPKQLENIFSKIGDDISKEGAGYDLDVNEVTLQDVVTPQFVLPSGNSSVTVYVEDIDKVNTSGPTSTTITGYTWKNRETVWQNGNNIATTQAYKDIRVTVSGNTVDVVGFDFSANWVGLNITKSGESVTKVETHTTGKRLVIEIVIQIDPNYEGGDNMIPTNDESKSGIFVGGTQTTPIVVYHTDPATVYAPLPLKITKAGGLELGESILYTIERGTMVGGVWTKDETFSTMTVALTKDSNDGSLSETLGRLPARKMVNGEYVDYLYKVTEDTTWAWAHKTSTPVVKTQKLFDSESNYVPVSFDFATAPDTAGAIRKDEKARANEFGK